MLLTILTFIVMLSILVLVHELGHFLVAKKFGIKVEEFGFGFPPRVWGKKIGETLYSINLLPIGGFVKLYGEDEAGGGRIKPSTIGHQPSTNLDRAFFAKPTYQKVLVVVAGVFMNFLLAIIIITGIFTFSGIPTPTNQVIVTQVLDNSPADISGLKSGDKILKINSIAVSDTPNLISETKKHLGEKIVLTIERNSKTQIIEVTPRKNYPKGEGPMGIAIAQNIISQKYPFPQSLFKGTKQAAGDAYLTVVGFKGAVLEIFTHFTVPQGVAGPVGMAQLTGEFVKIGPVAVMSLVYMLSLSLAVINILPIPALDGGKLFFILVQSITRRKVNPKFEGYVHMAGIIILLTFLAVVSYKDILRIIAGQSILPQ